MANERNVDPITRAASSSVGGQQPGTGIPSSTTGAADAPQAAGPPGRRRERRDEQVQNRRQERIHLRERQKRQRSINMIGAALAAVLVLGLIAWFAVSQWDAYQGRQRLDDVVEYTAYTDPDLSAGAAETDGSPFQHVTGPVEFEEYPPVGGPHDPTWQECGYYAAEIPARHAVHSLEHGAVWITYDPALSQSDIDQLADLADQGYVLVSPAPDLPAPVVASAWGHQLYLDGVDDNGLDAFIEEYRLGDQTPEQGATCNGGNTGTLAVAS